MGEEQTTWQVKRWAQRQRPGDHWERHATQAIHRDLYKETWWSRWTKEIKGKCYICRRQLGCRCIRMTCRSQCEECEEKIKGKRTKGLTFYPRYDSVRFWLY